MTLRLLCTLLGSAFLLAACSSDATVSDAGTDASADAPPGRDSGTDAPVDTGPPPPPMLANLPGCPGDVVTAADVAAITGPGCAGPMCHNLGSATAVKSAWVNKPSSQTSLIPLVKPTDPDSSYVLYKLLGQPKGGGGSGDRMPRNEPALSDADFCKIHDWVKGGAM